MVDHAPDGALVAGTAELGTLLDYSTSYISRVETGNHSITDIGALRHIAQCLGLPPHVFGITDDADGDHRAMIQFGESVLRLAEIARQAGQAAVYELWPLVARLEARATDGHTDSDVLRLLARARVGLGVALGHVLPEERLATAARWTYRMYDDDRVGVRNRLLAAAAEDLPVDRRDDLADYLHLIALLSCDLYPEQDKDIRDTSHYQWAADVLNTPIS